MEQKRVEDIYEIEEIIGEGTFSSVVRGIHNETKTAVAIKIIDKTKIDNPKSLNRIHNEISLHKKARHPNITSYIEHYETDIDVCIVMELCRGGELFDKIVHKKCFSEKDASNCIRQILLAVQYLHSIGIVHRDIKPENLLYTSQEEGAIIKLADFGLAKALEGPSGRDMLKASLSGTPAYCAPERLNLEIESKAVDMWSIGCIMYFMLFGVPPFYSQKEDEEEHDNEVIDSVIEGNVSFPDGRNVSMMAKDLILRLLDKDPTRRLTAEQALNHPWVKSHSLSDLDGQSVQSHNSEPSILKSSINKVIDSHHTQPEKDDDEDSMV